MTYSQSISLQKNQVYRRGQNTHSMVRAGTRLGPVSTVVIVLAIISLLGVMYLSQVTRTNSLGYELAGLRQDEVGLQREISDLEVEAVRLQSIETVRSSQVATNLVPIKPSSYAN
jgi:hypothetical protein